MVFQPRGTSLTPVAVGDRMVASTQAHGAVAVGVSKKDDKLTTELAWQNKEMKSNFFSGVAGGKLLFLVTNIVEPLPATAITCLEANTGKELWKSVTSRGGHDFFLNTRLPGFVQHYNNKATV
jgi:outer membrane protein assembly factor BamB